MVDLLKFTFNKKKKLIEVVVLVYNQVCCQILSKVYLCWTKKIFRVITKFL